MRIMLSACCVMTFAACAMAQPVINEMRCDFSNPHGWWASRSNTINFINDVRSGKCMEVNYDGNQAQPLALTYPLKWQMELINDRIEISVSARGKGVFRFALLCRNSRGENHFMPMSDLIHVDSPGKWENKKHIFMFTPETGGGFSRTSSYDLTLVINPGSSICFDDLACVVTSGSVLQTEQNHADDAEKPPVPTAEDATNITQVPAYAKGVVKEFALSDLRDIHLRTHVNEKLAAPPPGNAARLTATGVDLEYAFNTDKHDACMFAFDIEIPTFDQVAVTTTADNSKFRPFIVLKDAGGECHFFPLIDSKRISGQLINWSGKKTVTREIAAQTPFGDLYASRWGGDDNQTIDFPVKSIILGLGKYPDAAKGTGKISFEKIVFSRK